MVGSYWSSKQEEKLKNNHKITSGRITKYHKQIKASWWYKYEFYVGPKKFDGSYSVVEFNNEFINKNFPVIYNPSDPTENQMLIFYEDFEKYAEVYPDSIRWATKYK